MLLLLCHGPSSTLKADLPTHVNPRVRNERCRVSLGPLFAVSHHIGVYPIKEDFVHVDAEVSLLQAASLFQNRRIKFLPIIVPGSATVLALISHVEILEVRAGVGRTRINCL